MHSLPNAIEAVKRAAVEAVEAGKPVSFLFGQVVSAKPLKIQVDQKTMYTEKMLVLTRNVTDFELDANISAVTEEISHSHTVKDTYTGGGTVAAISHNHPITGKKKLKIQNGLVVGDFVLLARMQRGKRFIVLDRIKPHPAIEGEFV